MKLTSVKLELVVYPTKEGDSIPKKEENSKKAAQRFFDSKVGLKRLT